MSWAGLNINLSFSQREIERKPCKALFVPNERFPLQMLPSIKNQIKHWSSAFHRVHSLQNTYPCTRLICDLLSSQRGTWRIGGLPHGLLIPQSAVSVRARVFTIHFMLAVLCRGWPLWVNPHTQQQVTSVRQERSQVWHLQFTEIKNSSRDCCNMWPYSTTPLSAILPLKCFWIMWRWVTPQSYSVWAYSLFLHFYRPLLSAGLRQHVGSLWLVCLRGSWWQWSLQAVFLNIIQPSDSLRDSSELKVQLIWLNAWCTF